MDDFTRAFFGGAGGSPSVKSFRLEDLLAGLAAVAPHDWRGFFAGRVERIRAAPPLEGIEAAGWRLGWAAEPSAREKSDALANETTNLSGSIGLVLGKENRIVDVVPGSPAAKAGIPSGARLLGVNGRVVGKERLADALAGSARGEPIDLLVQDADVFLGARLDYRGGPRHPALLRGEGRPDLLAAIAAPRTAAGATVSP